MEQLIGKYLASFSPGVLAAALILFCALFWTLFQNRKAINDFLNDWYIRRKKKDELLRTIQENQTEIKQLMENRLHDRKQSLAIQKELTDAQKELANAISSISEKIDEMQKNTDKRFQESEQKNNKRIRAELKDKISQSYRYYHALGTINDMELEALEDLIEEYEAADGSNSFIHSIVQKEMYIWEKVNRV